MRDVPPPAGGSWTWGGVWASVCSLPPFVSAPLSRGHVVVLWDGATVCPALTSAVGHGSPAGSEPAPRAPSSDDAVAPLLAGVCSCAWGCRHSAPQARALPQQELMLAQAWRPEREVSRPGSLLELGERLPFPLRSPGVAGSLGAPRRAAASSQYPSRVTWPPPLCGVLARSSPHGIGPAPLLTTTPVMLASGPH